MPKIESFRELQVYRRANRQARILFQRSHRFPKEEKYSLTDQIRRSSRAVTALLAEAWARRRYQSAFVNKVNQALGEAMETQAWLDHARTCGYLDQEEYETFDEAWDHIGAMLRRMIQRADGFCSSSS
ncbi:MAG: four helix bundle protein [Salinivenus sp.]